MQVVDVKTQKITMTLRVSNACSNPLPCDLEPWTESYTIAPEDTVEITAHGPGGDTLELVVADDRITVYGWAGSIVTLRRAGTTLEPDVPEDPPGPDILDLSDAREVTPNSAPVYDSIE